MFGKFKKALKERCPLCNNTLQIRVRYTQTLNKGIEIDVPVEYIACSNRGCFYERDMEQKTKKNKGEIPLDDIY